MNDACNETICRGVFRIAGNGLLFVLLLEDAELLGPIADNVQVGVIHRKFAEPQNATAMIDVCLSGEGRSSARPDSSRWLE